MQEALPFGAWLKQRRRALDLTQQEVAQRALCSLSTLRKIEAARTQAQTTTLESLVAAISQR